MSGQTFHVAESLRPENNIYVSLNEFHICIQTGLSGSKEM